MVCFTGSSLFEFRLTICLSPKLWSWVTLSVGELLEPMMLLAHMVIMVRLRKVSLRPQSSYLPSSLFYNPWHMLHNSSTDSVYPLHLTHLFPNSHNLFRQMNNERVIRLG